MDAARVLRQCRAADAAVDSVAERLDVRVETYVRTNRIVNIVTRDDASDVLPENEHSTLFAIECLERVASGSRA